MIKKSHLFRESFPEEAACYTNSKNRGTTRGFFVTENPLRGFPVMFGSLLRAGNVRCSVHFPHWQPEMYFAPGTRPGAKCFLLVGITVCGEKQKPRDDPRFCNKKKGKENEKDEG